jgi:uracil-DNA glycosylase
MFDTSGLGVSPFHTEGSVDKRLSSHPPITDWKQLRWWSSGEEQVVNEKLKDLDKRGTAWCPGSGRLYRGLDLTRPDDIRVVILGQDPYPDLRFATGVAFSIPPAMTEYPPTLAMILKELQTDIPGFTLKNGDLTPWLDRGVLLLNAIPTCEAGKSKSHHWPEYEFLTGEILNELSLYRDVVFVFMGSTAREYDKYVFQLPWCGSRILYTSHPSPRGNTKSQTPFLGSRIFSTINLNLTEMGKKVIDWRL